MGFFGSRPKVSIEEFFRDFYDQHIFQSQRAVGVDMMDSICDILRDRLIELDPRTNAIGSDLLREEITALRLELIALAWFHKFKKDSYTVTQSFRTAQYLSERQRINLWEAMGAYNGALAESATSERSLKSVRVVEARFDMWKRCCAAVVRDQDNPTEEENVFLNCVSRAANRIGVNVGKSDWHCEFMTATLLAERLGVIQTINRAAADQLAYTARMLYNGAEEGLRSASVRPSG